MSSTPERRPDGLAPEVREALGLGATDRLDLVASVPAPPSATARGFVAIQTPFDQLLESELSAQPDFEVLAMPSQSTPAVRISRWRPLPAIVLLEGELGDLRLVGSTRVVEAGRAVALDGRSGPCWARFEDWSGDWITRLDEERVDVFRATSEPSAALFALRDFVPPPPLALPDPDIDRLLDGLPVEQWLVEAARRMTEGGALGRVIAAGLVARLWSPRPAMAHREKILARLLAADSPADRVRRWFADLEPSLMDELAVGIAIAAEDAALWLNILEAAVIEDPAAARPQARAWLHLRDDLECVSWLCRDTAIGARVSGALVDLDAAATGRHSLWSLLDDFSDDDRLRAVAWQDPEAWWGALASQ